MTHSAPATEGGSRSREELRRRQGLRARTAGRRCAIMLSGLVALALATSGCTAAQPSGSHAVHPSHASTAVPPRHRVSDSHSVQLVVEASGDLLIHSPIFERALVLGGGRHYDFAPFFVAIKPYIQGADLALCHVETPMTPAPPTGYPTFNTPPELATAIRQTGWRACSTAATHSLDQGQTGVDDTIRALDRAGVAHTGTFSSAAAQQTPLIMTVKGVRVAFLAYTELTNGIPSPHPWSVNRANAAQILSDAHRARLDGAQVVIVNIHWGDQYVAQPSSFQLALANTLTRSADITAVVGQHVHIVQPIRILNGKPVVFGEGNLISNQTSACCPTASQDGMIVLLTITVDNRGARVTLIRYVPIWVRHPDFVVLPAGTAWRTDPADAAALRDSYERTVAVVGRGPGIEPIPAHLLPGPPSGRRDACDIPAARMTTRCGPARWNQCSGTEGAVPRSPA
ncbi:MAG TPA: CapA family protein [Streptosporangiaceae bacterium]|nr:CapA family protein [Streptosporangiaceae bacterium]